MLQMLSWISDSRHRNKHLNGEATHVGLAVRDGVAPERPALVTSPWRFAVSDFRLYWTQPMTDMLRC
eukprot:3147436-Amphidinium_carterae.1